MIGIGILLLVLISIAYVSNSIIRLFFKLYSVAQENHGAMNSDSQRLFLAAKILINPADKSHGGGLGFIYSPIKLEN